MKKLLLGFLVFCGFGGGLLVFGVPLQMIFHFVGFWSRVNVALSLTLPFVFLMIITFNGTLEKLCK